MFVRLNEKTHSKIRKFTQKHNIAQSKVLAVILQDEKIIIKPRTYGQIVMDAKYRGDVNTFETTFSLTKEEELKLKQLAERYNSTRDEIIRQYITHAKFRTYKMGDL